MKAYYDDTSSTFFLELFDPIVATTAGTTLTLTLENGDIVELEVTADAEGVFIQVQAAATETGDISLIDCECLIRAVLSIDTVAPPAPPAPPAP